MASQKGSQQWCWCSVGALVLQTGGSVDDGVMLLARCGTAAPSLFASIHPVVLCRRREMRRRPGAVVR